MYYTPTPIDFEGLKFLIMSAPVDTTMEATVKVLYILVFNSKQELKKKHVTVVVRTCEKTYDDKLITDNGIHIEDLPFPDGKKPSKEIILRWKKIVND